MMAISEELYKKLELADFTKDDISLFREKTNAKVAKQGKNNKKKNDIETEERGRRKQNAQR